MCALSSLSLRLHAGGFLFLSLLRLSSPLRRDICVWDLRSPAGPLHRLQGHHELPATAPVRAMHRALYIANGRYIVASGENSERLSIYEVRQPHLTERLLPNLILIFAGSNWQDREQVSFSTHVDVWEIQASYPPSLLLLTPLVPPTYPTSLPFLEHTGLSALRFVDRPVDRYTDTG